MEHYILKIYRKESQTAPRRIVGTVENMADQQSCAFHNADELVAILGAWPRGVTKAVTTAHCHEPGVEPKK